MERSFGLRGCSDYIFFQLTSPMQAVDGFESDRESEEGQAEQPHPPATSAKSKATAPGKAEQRRTRKREKVYLSFS